MPALERYPSIYPEEADVNASSERFIKHSSSKFRTQLRGAFNRLINSTKKRSVIKDFSSAGPSGSSNTTPIIYAEIQEAPEVLAVLVASISNSLEMPHTEALICIALNDVPPVLNALGEFHITDLEFLENRRNILHKKTHYFNYPRHVHVPGTPLPPHLRVPVVKTDEAKVHIGISPLNPLHPCHESFTMWDSEYVEEFKEGDEKMFEGEPEERDEEEYEEEYDSLDDYPTEDFYSCIEFDSDDDISARTSYFFNLDNTNIGELHFEVDDSDDIIEVPREIEICGRNKGKTRTTEDFTKHSLKTISVRMQSTPSQDSTAQGGSLQLALGEPHFDPTSSFDHHLESIPTEVLDLLDATDDDDVTQLSHSSEGRLGTVWTSVYPFSETFKDTIKWFSLSVMPEIVLSGFSREVEALYRIQDCVEEVCSIETFWTSTTAAAYSMKWMGVNTLRDYMYDGTTLYSLQETARQVLRLIKGVNKMHKLGVIHGNIRPETIMVGPTNDFIIFDFENATVLDLDHMKFEQNLNNPDSLWTRFANNSQLPKGSTTISFDVDYTAFAEIWHEMRTGESFKHVHSKAFGDNVQMREDILFEDEMEFIQRLLSKRKGRGCRFETLQEIQQHKVFTVIQKAL